MSNTKYVKVANKRLKISQYVLFFVGISTIIFLFIRLFIENPSDPLAIFLYLEFYLSLIFVCLFIYLYLINWKSKILFAEEDIYETVVHRKKTPIAKLALSKNLKKTYVVEIIENLITQEKLSGKIIDGIYSSDYTLSPTCPLCHDQIDEDFLMVLCSYCKRPFHKNHLIDYLNEVEEKCPLCKKILTLADIIK